MLQVFTTLLKANSAPAHPLSGNIHLAKMAQPLLPATYFKTLRALAHRVFLYLCATPGKGVQI
jgi:hypothetical protein